MPDGKKGLEGLMDTLFLNEDQLRELTGRKMRRLQIETLRVMGIPFRVNAAGRPVVCRSAVEGTGPSYNPEPKSEWQPAVLSHGQKAN